MVRRQLRSRRRNHQLCWPFSNPARDKLIPRTHLLLGPWVHGVDNTEKTKSGEREFAANAEIDYDEVVLRWMDHYLRGIDNGVDQEKPVRYYVMGSNEWRDASTWPPLVNTLHRITLSPEQR